MSIRHHPAEIVADRPRRHLLKVAAGAVAVSFVEPSFAKAERDAGPVNLAMVAKPGALHVSDDTALAALNSGVDPARSDDVAGGVYGTWPRTDRQWVTYEWDQPVTTDSIDVFWWQDGRGIALPRSARLLYWNGAAFVPVRAGRGLGMEADRYNRVAFDPVTTTRLKLEFSGDGRKSAGILQWKVYSSGPVPAFAPVVAPGVDRAMVIGGQTYLAGRADWLRRQPGDTLRWSKASGPGEVIFADAAAPGAGRLKNLALRNIPSGGALYDVVQQDGRLVVRRSR